MPASASAGPADTTADDSAEALADERITRDRVVAEPVAEDEGPTSDVVHSAAAEDAEDEAELAPRPSRFSRPPAPALRLKSTRPAPSTAPAPDSELDSHPALDPMASVLEPVPAPETPSTRRTEEVLADLSMPDDAIADHDSLGDNWLDESLDESVYSETATYPEDEDQDPNATTLISRQDPESSERPSKPPVSVFVAGESRADDDDVDSAVATTDDDFDDAPMSGNGFVPEDEEPPISLPLAEPASLGGDSVQKAFFRPEEETLAPVVDDLDDDRDEVEDLPISPALRARRQGFRRVVGGVVAVVGLLTIGLAVKSALSDSDQSTDRPAAAAAALVPAVAPAAADARDDAEASDEANADDASPAADEATGDEASAEVATEIDTSDVDAVTDETLRLLNERKFEEAIVMAEKLIALTPDNAFGYRCLGSAYQDLGRYPEARDAYSKCVTHATKGDVHECSLLGGAPIKQ